jgi:hypothetical protein
MQIVNPAGITLSVNGRSRNLGPQAATGPLTLTIGPGTKLVSRPVG